MSGPRDQDLRSAFEELHAPRSTRDYALRTGRVVSARAPRSGRAAAAAALAAVVALGGALAFIGLRGAMPAGVTAAPVLPPARSDSAMAYDSTSRQTVMFGGVGAGHAQLTDTWEWSGRSWTRFGGAGPPALAMARMVDDPRDRGVLLVGWDVVSRAAPRVCVAPATVNPAAATCSAAATQTWLFVDHAWRRVGSDRSQPAPPAGAVVATVLATGAVVAVAVVGVASRCVAGSNQGCSVRAWEGVAPGAGSALPTCVVGNTGVRSVAPGLGLTTCGQARFAWQTWLWESARWAPVTTEITTGTQVADLLPSVNGEGLDFEPQGEPVVPVCDSTGGGCQAPGSPTAWSWNGAGWTAAGGAAPVPSIASAAETSAGAQTLVFTPTGATWVGSPGGWNEIDVFGPSEPGPRVGEALATDRNGKTLMFGGSVSDSGLPAEPTADTWLWDGSSWSRVTMPR